MEDIKKRLMKLAPYLCDPCIDKIVPLHYYDYWSDETFSDMVHNEQCYKCDSFEQLFNKFNQMEEDISFIKEYIQKYFKI